MSKFKVGDLVKGLPESNGLYDITNDNMTKAVVKSVDGEMIVVKVLEHKFGYSGKHLVNEKYFEKIGHLEPFDREKFLELLKESKAKATEYLRGADLSDANLSYANLRGANLSDADLSYANLIYADLRGADLRGANLRRANLRRADLRRADLSDADLSYANLIYADLRGADLSGSHGLLDAINFMEAHFERTDEGYIVYKSFGENYTAPETWKIEPGEIIEETVNCDRTTECGCGINVAPLEWVRREGCNQPYKLLIRWEWLLGVVVPYNTDGKIRCSKAQILEAVE